MQKESQELRPDELEGANGARAHKGAGGRCALFVVVAIVWLIIDQTTKAVFKGMVPGTLVAGPFCGIFDIRLVHNTGAAWGIFSDSTFALGVLSVVVCAAVAAYFFASRNSLNVVESLGMSLVVSGGVGNAIDRFAQGFVTDFIEPVFIDFPVFNVADIGVVCGFVLIFIGIAVAFSNERHLESNGEDDDRAANNGTSINEGE